MVYWHVLKFIFSRFLSVHMPHLEIFNFCLLPIPQLFGNSDGIGNSMEHNVVSGRCVLRLYKMFTVSTETYIDHLIGRHGMWKFILTKKDFKSSLLLYCNNALMILSFSMPQILSYLSLAAACSTASVTDLLLDADGSYCPSKLCGRYQLSAAMAFLSWFLSSTSCLFNFWLFPSL